MVFCPTCGELELAQVELYDASLRRQAFGHTPIRPTCRKCHAPLRLLHRCSGGELIVLTGTCGSGKSTVAELLAQQGWAAIDGDCVLQTMKHNGVKADYRQITAEIARELDWLSLYGNKFVVATVIHPEDVAEYQALFAARGLRSRFYLLKPAYAAVVQRCQTRTCHRNITPEYWIDYFYRLLEYGADVTPVDNTNLTPQQTAGVVLADFGQI